MTLNSYAIYRTVIFLMTLNGIWRSFRWATLSLYAQLTRDLLAIAKFLVINWVR